MLNYLLPVSLGVEAILLVLLLYLLIRYKRLYRAYDTFMRGKDAETLEDNIVDIYRRLQSFRVLNKNQRASLQKFGVVRYNAFKEMGGNMSFALAELDYTNSGFIINTVHSREGCYLYIKTVDCGQTEVLLSAEEKEALEQALGYLDR